MPTRCQQSRWHGIDHAGNSVAGRLTRTVAGSLVVRRRVDAAPLPGLVGRHDTSGRRATSNQVIAPDGFCSRGSATTTLGMLLSRSRQGAIDAANPLQNATSAQTSRRSGVFHHFWFPAALSGNSSFLGLITHLAASKFLDFLRNL